MSFSRLYLSQGRNDKKNLGSTVLMVNTICLGWNRVKVSENLDVTGVIPVAPVDTSLTMQIYVMRTQKRAASLVLLILSPHDLGGSKWS